MEGDLPKLRSICFSPNTVNQNNAALTSSSWSAGRRSASWQTADLNAHKQQGTDDGIANLHKPNIHTSNNDK